MADDILIRPMATTDVDEAHSLAVATLDPPEASVTDWEAVERARITHFLISDPDGAFVAVDAGRIVGLVLAGLRERLWLGSLLAVAPSTQGQGVGTRLLRHALRYGPSNSGRLLVSSAHGAAMRAYSRAGFRLQPALSVRGLVKRGALPKGLRSTEAQLHAVRHVVDRLSTQTRGAAHGDDLSVLLAEPFNGRLLTYADRGYAIAADGSVVLLAAIDAEAGVDLLWSALALADEHSPVQVEYVGGDSAWAIETAVCAGLTPKLSGPIGVIPPARSLAAYIPNPYIL